MEIISIIIIVAALAAALALGNRMGVLVRDVNDLDRSNAIQAKINECQLRILKRMSSRLDELESENTDRISESISHDYEVRSLDKRFTNDMNEIEDRVIRIERLLSITDAPPDGEEEPMVA